ncbi:MAG TPA: hypothetical protein VNJ08_08530 [Bacteriovoracaceae bacterium]|nr:hypothetical protein [Bacteriovoracaceae bacterium]
MSLVVQQKILILEAVKSEAPGRDDLVLKAFNSEITGEDLVELCNIISNHFHYESIRRGLKLEEVLAAVYSLGA